MPIDPRVVRYSGAMFDQDEISAVMAQLQDPMGLLPGKKVAEFEARVAAYMGKAHGVMVNSGSSALMVAFRLANLPQGSEVITPALTFSSDVAAIYHVGCVPVFLDVGLDDYQAQVDQIEAVINQKTRAILIPDLVGGICDWDVVRRIADDHDLVVIHDSADTLGGKLRGRHTATRADISITSFSPHHIITAMGTGGMVFFDDTNLLDRALALRSWGRSSEKFISGTRVKDSDGRFLEDLDGIEYDGLFIFEENAYGFIPSECGAAFGIEQMNKIERLWALREERFAWHTEYLRQHEDKFILPQIIPDTETTWLCYPVQIRPTQNWSRRKFQLHLEDAGIMCRVIFSGNITRHPMMNGYEYRIHPDGLAHCDQIMEYGIMLPCHPTMTREDCDYLYQVVDEFIEADGDPKA